MLGLIFSLCIVSICPEGESFKDRRRRITQVQPSYFDTINAVRTHQTRWHS